jgi:hypothetical protein
LVASVSPAASAGFTTGTGFGGGGSKNSLPAAAQSAPHVAQRSLEPGPFVQPTGLLSATISQVRFSLSTAITSDFVP